MLRSRDHLANQDQLLIVLLAEEDSVGRHDLQQLADHGQHAGEMCGPGRALELGSERAGVHRGPRAVRVHRDSAWGEGNFDSFTAQQREVVVEDPRVGVQILVGAELQRVDEDRHHYHRTGHSLGGADKREVSVVQRAHGRHQHHSSTGVAQGAADLADIAGVRVDVQFAGIELRRPLDAHRASTSSTSSGACTRWAVRIALTR